MKQKQKKADQETGESGIADKDDDGLPQGEGQHDETGSEMVLYDKELAKKARDRYGRLQYYRFFLLKYIAYTNRVVLTYPVLKVRIRIRIRTHRIQVLLGFPD
jgi:hypothetical protein